MFNVVSAQCLGYAAKKFLD